MIDLQPSQRRRIGRAMIETGRRIGDLFMHSIAHWVRRSANAGGRVLPAMGVAVLCWACAPQPASAQFGIFGQEDASPQDAYDTIASHGFRLAGPLMQSRDVYIADVIDRRQRRQRLIISRSGGRILQRYLVDVSGRSGPYADLPGGAYGGPLPPRVARPNSDFFSRLVRGFGDDAPPRPPADVDNPDRDDAVEPRTLPRSQRLARPRPSDVEPRLATRRDESPITSRPLTPEPAPPSSAAPASPPAAPAASAPAVPVSPPADRSPAASQQPAPASPPPTRATVVNTDPLRIPGTKDQELSKPAGAATAAAKPVGPAASPKPAAKAAPTDVPVAPLD